MERLTDGATETRAALAADLAALCLFVLAGIRSHHEAAAFTVFLRTAVPLVGAWLVLAPILRTYRPPTIRRLVKTWSIAIPTAVVLRTLLVGADGWRVLVFLAVAMIFTLVFLLVGRLVVAGAVARSRRRGRV